VKSARESKGPFGKTGSPRAESEWAKRRELPALRGERNAMIRHTISCDMCGAQKREANHWFIAYEESGELNVSSWVSPHLYRSGTKHLCGESCLHKLLSTFLAQAVQLQSPQICPSSVPQLAVSLGSEGVAAGSRALLHVQRQLTSTGFRSGQYATRESETERQRCTGRRTS